MSFKKQDLFTNLYYSQLPDEKTISLAMQILQQQEGRNDGYLLKGKFASNRNRCVYMISNDDQIYYVKKYHNKTLKYVVRDFLRPQKGVRAFLICRALHALDIGCAQVMLAMVYTKAVFNKPSIALSKHIPGLTLKQLLQADLT